MPLKQTSQELPEQEFIHEEYSSHPWRFWGWLAAVIGCSLLFSWGLAQYSNRISEEYLESPFLQVSNREMSLFLWQNPAYMRSFVENKNGYLPAFEYAERVGLNPEYADEYVIAPPELLFNYHTWKRLLGSYVPPRKIPSDEFQTFLLDVSEWQPRYWKAAPKGYRDLVEQLSKPTIADLSQLQMSMLPTEVRQAFFGWKNFFIEGELINSYKPTYQQLAALLEAWPHYARPYWRNLSGQQYLWHRQVYDSEQIIPSDELSAQLRVGLFNFTIGM